MALAIAATALGWKPFREVVLGRGKDAVARIEWAGDGGWSLTDRAGRIHPATLCASSVTLGTWLLLRWQTPGGRLFLAIVEAGGTQQAAFRALKGRLNC